MLATTHRTLRDFIAAGYRLSANCTRSTPPCWHSSPIDLAELAALLGADFDLYAKPDTLRPRFRCTACGTRGASFRISPK